MARTIRCAQCEKQFVVADGYQGRPVCPYCGAGGGPRAEAPAPAPAQPRLRGRKGRREAPRPTETATARAARQAWERVPLRHRRARHWPPARRQGATALAEALRRRARARRRWLNPYLLLLIVLAALLALFALVASRHPGAAVPRETARPPAPWETTFTG